MSKSAHVSTHLSLFTSFSTLFCCALPALLVALGAGAALASVVSAVPELVWISRHKIEVFSFATVMLSLSGYLQWRARHAPCPADPAQAKACGRQRRVSRVMYGVSLCFYLTGGFFAFVAPWVLA